MEILLSPNNFLLASFHALVLLYVITCIGSGVDFDSNPITINFTSGETNKTVAIPVMCDSVIERAETFNIDLSIVSISDNMTVELGLTTSTGVINDSTG